MMSVHVEDQKFVFFIFLQFPKKNFKGEGGFVDI